MIHNFRNTNITSNKILYSIPMVILLVVACKYLFKSSLTKLRKTFLTKTTFNFNILLHSPPFHQTQKSEIVK